MFHNISSSTTSVCSLNYTCLSWWLQVCLNRPGLNHYSYTLWIAFNCWSNPYFMHISQALYSEHWQVKWIILTTRSPWNPSMSQSIKQQCFAEKKVSKRQGHVRPSEHSVSQFGVYWCVELQTSHTDPCVLLKAPTMDDRTTLWHHMEERSVCSVQQDNAPY